MPFKKINANQIIQNKINSDPEFAKLYNVLEIEHQLIDEITNRRKELEISIDDLAEKTGIKKSVLLKIESKSISLTLTDFINIIGYLDLKIKMEIK